MHKVCLLLVCALLMLTTVSADEPIPEPVPLIDAGGRDIINILLIGSATDNPYNPGLTDGLMLISVDRESGAVSLLSLPRDLYVYVPGFGMGKINQAYFLAETRGEAGSGSEVLKATIQHNLGLVVDYTVRLNFASFSQVIDALGGIDITVDCAIEDWKLIEPELDKQNPDNWEMVTLEAGRHHLDGDWALWYVRSRRTSSDLDRGRRQQDVMRAIWRQLRADGLLSRLPALWDDFVALVDTDISLTDALSLAPVAAELSTADMRYFTFRVNQEVTADYTPDEGRFIFRIDQEAVAELLTEMMQPPSDSQFSARAMTVAVVNAGAPAGMAHVAADRMELEGFRTVVLDEAAPSRDYTDIIDYTGQTKGSPVERLQRLLRVTAEGVTMEPDPDREYDYRVYVGYTYAYYACTRNVVPPSIYTDPEATPEPSP